MPICGYKLYYLFTRKITLLLIVFHTLLLLQANEDRLIFSQAYRDNDQEKQESSYSQVRVVAKYETYNNKKGNQTYITKFESNNTNTNLITSSSNDDKENTNNNNNNIIGDPINRFEHDNSHDALTNNKCKDYPRLDDLDNLGPHNSNGPFYCPARYGLSCETCGDCWLGWARAVDGLRNETQQLLNRVQYLLEVGTPGAWAKEFSEIESKLNRIKCILDNQKLTEDDIRNLAAKIKELSDKLKELERTLNELEGLANDVTNRTRAVQAGLHDYDRTAEKLTLLIEGLRENATQFREANVDEAHKIILDSQNRSREADKKVRDLKPFMTDQESLRRKTETMFVTMASRYNSTGLQNEATLAALERQIKELEQGIPAINKNVCASSSTVDKCDQLCGGSMCNKCGGSSCTEAATTKASNALDLAQQAWALLNQKFNQSQADLDAINEAKRLSEEALAAARSVLADCELQKNKFDKVGNELNSIMDGIEKFNMVDGAKPAEVRTLGTECLGLTISLTPEQILALARQINDTISSLTNIDAILQATAADLATAEQLKLQADRAKEAADNILETVEQVLNMLRLAALEQARAAAAIATAQADIEGAQADLVEINTDTEKLLRIVTELAAAIKKLQDRLNELRKKYAQNELYISQTKTTADEASKLADQAEKDADELADKVRLAQEKLANKATQNGVMKDRAERLKNDALQLAGEIQLKLNINRELDDWFDEQLKRLKDFQDIVDDLHKQMNQYLKDIDAKAQYYRECQT